MSEHGIVSVADVHALAEIVHAAIDSKPVRWVNDAGDLNEGTARAISHHGGGFLTDDDDVRDGFLHISAGGEYWLPVPRLVDMLRRGEFVVQS